MEIDWSEQTVGKPTPMPACTYGHPRTITWLGEQRVRHTHGGPENANELDLTDYPTGGLYVLELGLWDWKVCQYLRGGKSTIVTIYTAGPPR